MIKHYYNRSGIVDTNVVFLQLSVLELGTGEKEIDKDTLVWLSSNKMLAILDDKLLLYMDTL